ncbi:Aste57867_69 [Aphanomyces stellatus]|uniref:Aste57867_69 protein n=1 Tax=Aphanomyces stellatus TaxID=120398 RepID=A0A485K248_9STRA|nr:hypothetical protein As57867_000069 [Aphanomyces stellatus]VFT77295.1 Aste57867_69 [Aphanomyces stellatus]
MPTHTVSVVPHGVTPASTSPMRRRRVMPLVGLIYLGAAVASSWWFNLILYQSIQNDTLWYGFNASVQAWLMDALNRAEYMLTLDSDLTSLVHAQDRTDAAPLRVALLPTVPRLFMYTRALAPAVAIASCRQTSPDNLVWLSTQYCWVDFNRTWELAHTAARQARCARAYATNGAMFLEAVLRNTDMAAFLSTFGGPSGVFTTAIVATLNHTNVGQSFLGYLVAHVQPSVADEVAFWASFDVTMWGMQFQNFFQVGVDNHATLGPALGTTPTLSINAITKINRSPLWTTWIAFTSFYDDMAIAQMYGGGSMIRSDPTFVWGDDSTLAGYDTGSQLFHDAIGPLYSVDMYWLAPPAPLLALVRAYTAALRHAQWTDDAFGHTFAALEPLVATPSSIGSWPSTDSSLSWGFLSGSPLCPSWASLSTVYLREWGFDDACAVQTPLTVPLDRFSLVFAMAATSTRLMDMIAQSVCATTGSTACLAVFAQAASLATTILDSSPSVAAAVPLAAASASSIEVVQFGLHESATPCLLRHAILDPRDPVFAFLAWSYLYDWTTMTREVVSFQGDVATLDLISYRYSVLGAFSMTPVAHELAQSIVSLLAGGVLYVTAAISAVAAAVAALGLAYRLDFCGRNLVFFHRVAAFTWIGRPLLFLRGVTAILLLASSSTTLASKNGLTRLNAHPRSVSESMLVASEATWVSYVVCDLCHVQLPHAMWFVGPASSAAVFLTSLALDIWHPIPVTLTSTSECQLLGVDATVACAQLTVANGSPPRVLFLLVVSVAAVLGSMFVAAAGLRWRMIRPKTLVAHAQALFPGSSLAFLAWQTELRPDDTYRVSLDQVANVMSGIFVLERREAMYVLDVKSWQCLPLATDAVDRRGSHVHFYRQPFVSPRQSPDASATKSVPLESTWLSHARLAGSFVYIVTALVSSIVYFTLLEQTMSNDFWWTGFNTTGGHRFLANVLPMNMLLPGTPATTISLTDPQYALFALYNTSSTTVATYGSIARWAKHTVLNDLGNAIQGLRHMDGCLAPWIAAQYCWLDFDHVWEMANTAARQSRCDATQGRNGAAHFEAVLRNIDQRAFLSCWQESFDVAIARTMATTTVGQVWLAQSMTGQQPALSIDAEVAFWQSKLLDTFILQWQNYKTVGLDNTVVVENAFAAAYPLTLQARSSTWRLVDQTTLQMYWMLAGDLHAVVTNDSGITGLSLVRQSPAFAFQNISIASVLQHNGSYVPPTATWTTDLLRQAVGPFGSIDVLLVPPPPLLVTIVRAVEGQLRALLFSNSTVAAQYAQLPVSWTLTVVPASWRAVATTYFQGSPLCAAALSAPTNFPQPYADATAVCVNLGSSEQIFARAWQVVMAGLLTGGGLRDTMCQHVLETNLCAKLCTSTASFVTPLLSLLSIPSDHLHSIATLVQKLNVSLLQFTTVDSEPQITTANAFAATDESFAFWAWCYLHQWTLGQREAVSLVGDAGSVTVLSTAVTVNDYALKSLEIPVSLSLYVLRGVQYVTIVLLALALVVIVLTLVSKGHVEPMNLLELNCVGAIVWVGRPLLLLRAASALCLLCTGHLTLQTSATGLATKFDDAATATTSLVAYAKTVLVSSEMGWLTVVLHDVLSVWTRECTRTYATKSFVVVWAATAVVQIASPVHVTAAVAPTCRALDFDIVCTSGRLAVGSFARVTAYVGLNVVAVVAGAVYAAWQSQVAAAGTTQQTQKLFMYSLATYVFHVDPWTVHGVVHLDKASALLNGLVVVGGGDKVFMMDIKTWRLYRLPRPNFGPSLAACVPLIDYQDI